MVIPPDSVCERLQTRVARTVHYGASCGLAPQRCPTCDRVFRLALEAWAEGYNTHLKEGGG